MTGPHTLRLIKLLLAIFTLIISATSVPVISSSSSSSSHNDVQAQAADLGFPNGGDADDSVVRAEHFELNSRVDVPWTRSADNSILVPASSTKSLSTRTEPDWLIQLRGRSYHAPPYCMQQILGWCSVTLVVRSDGKTVDLYVFDDRCIAKGYNKATLPVKAFKFGYLNGGEVILQQFSNAEPHSYTFHNRGYGWGFTDSWCWNAGVSSNYPGFRMACTSGFDCSMPESAAGKAARAEDLESNAGGVVQ